MTMGDWSPDVHSVDFEPMPGDDVKVIHRGDPKFVDAEITEPAPRRSKAQQIQTDILTDAEHLLRDARDMVDEALELFGLLSPPQHPNISTLLGQLIEQVIEFKRVKQ